MTTVFDVQAPIFHKAVFDWVVCTKYIDFSVIIDACDIYPYSHSL